MSKIETFFYSLDLLKTHKKIRLISLIPVLIGIILYVSICVGLLWFGIEAFQGILPKSTPEVYGVVGALLVSVLIGIIFFFVFQWTFVGIISIISTPFNDVLSREVEHAYLKKINYTGPEFPKDTRSFLQLLSYQFKKLFILGMVLIINLFLSFIPMVNVVCFFVAMFVISWEFLDYPWGRHGVSLHESYQNYRKNFWSYYVSVFFFALGLSIPVVNIFILPVGVIYFSILWVQHELAA